MIRSVSSDTNGLSFKKRTQLSLKQKEKQNREKERKKIAYIKTFTYSEKNKKQSCRV